VAVGDLALFNNTNGSSNVALGNSAGLQATGDNNVYIGYNMQGVPGESNACYIRSIFVQTAVAGIPVLIDGTNKLGTTTSSKRFKEEIKPMDKASEALLALKPVTFHYKKEIDPAGMSQFGLVAEEVEKVNPDLVVRDNEGKAYSVRYDQVNAMLLNEFLKEHRAFAEEQQKIERQQKEIDALKAELKEQRSLVGKVSDKVELKRSTSRVAASNP
jgi:Chaperone of endosialidase